MLVQQKYSQDDTVSGPTTSVGKRWTRERPVLIKYLIKLQKTNNPTLHSLNLLPSGLHHRINAMDIDLVHFHWINGEMIRIEEIAKIRKPIIWTLHDMWPFCGAEHYAGDTFQRYVEGCHLGNRGLGEGGVDLNRWVWQRKERSWRDIQFNIVTPSQWLQKCASSSKLFARYPIQHIPNGLDMTQFRPMPKNQIREKLSLPKNKKLILFGGWDSIHNPIKGWDHLKSALRILGNTEWKNNADLVIFGGKESRSGPEVSMPCHFVGHFSDPIDLASIYNAVDLFVLPSMQDNLPNTVLESLACGTPVAAFDIGGIGEMIKHRNHGYLAKPFAAEDLAAGMDWILNHSERWQQLSHLWREETNNLYAQTTMAKTYMDLYRSLLT